MPLFLNPRFAFLLLIAVPLAGGTVLHPHGASAFVMGAWAGALVVGPPLAFAMWVLRLRTLGETIAPIARLPMLIVATALILYYSGVDIGFGPVMAGAAGALWWIKRRLGFGLF
ncbi:hypothetical protein [Yoonia sp. 208BN28-4]|uniref:hypothetical protein n=1 Tax=Yoonia sp. 208BN28-4 TaxID=3126505 RepID=UPI0030B75C24